MFLVITEAPLGKYSVDTYDTLDEARECIQKLRGYFHTAKSQICSVVEEEEWSSNE